MSMALESPGFIAFLGMLAVCNAARPDPIMTTAKGSVRGKSQRVLGKEVHTFYGIPFAKPPLGDLRFKHPQPADPWSDTLDATKLPNSCAQGKDDFFGNFSGSTMWNPNTNVSEDCLYINVVVPQTSTNPKAVLVWIYGGGFYSGTNTLDIYDLKILATANDMIVVSMQYRVGMLGFLYLGHPDAPGNAGLFDQLMALQWVQDNIKYFNGDPDSVTIFGESAGAVSVSMHLLSPLSRNTFHRAIMNSGSALLSWATVTNADAVMRGTEVAVRLGCTHNDVQESIRCLKRKPALEIVANEWISTGICQFPHVPVVDGSFLVETPEMSMKQGNFKRCPILVGNVLNEGAYFMIYDIPDYFRRDTDSELTRRQFENSIDHFFNYYPQWPYSNNMFGLDAIKHHYTDWKNPDDTVSNRNGAEHAVADAMFICGLAEFAKYYADVGEDVYYYFYTHEYTQNTWPKWTGVMHGYELVIMFGEPLRKQSKFTDEEKQFSRKVMGYFTNFAKTGDPNKLPGRRSLNEWPIHTSLRREYLTLNTKYLNHPDKSAAIGSHLRARECAFWNQYLPPLVTGTADITEQEKEWKIQFNEWSTKYMVDWKNQYNQYVNKYSRSCDGV